MPEELPHLPGTEPLTLQGDLAAQMVAGLDRFLTREVAHSLDGQAALRQGDSACAANRIGTSV